MMKCKYFALILASAVLISCGGSSDPEPIPPVTETTVTSMTKTTIITPTSGAGTTTLTFTLKSAITELPTVAVTSLTENINAPTVGTCELDTEGTTLTCPVTKLAGCSTFADYQVTVSGDSITTDYIKNFNSADDEFDWKTVPVADMISEDNNDKC